MLTSARDITASVHPPRAVFLDYPLGHTAGRVGEPELDRSIVAAAIDALHHAEPGRIVDLPHRWAETDDWKDDVMRVDIGPDGEMITVDDRVARLPTPQYQSPADADTAERVHAGLGCEICPGVDY